MSLFHIFLASLLSFVFTPAFAGDKFVELDWSFNFSCKQSNEFNVANEANEDGQKKGLKANNHFYFKMLYKEDSNFDYFSGEELANGNGDVVFDVSVTQFPLSGPEINPIEVPLESCQKAPVTTTTKQNEDGLYSMELYFECDGDGDGGFGQIDLIQVSETESKVSGNISFPEGNHSLPYNFPEETNFELKCEPSFGF